MPDVSDLAPKQKNFQRKRDKYTEYKVKWQDNKLGNKAQNQIKEVILKLNWKRVGHASRIADEKWTKPVNLTTKWKKVQLMKWRDSIRNI